MQNFHNKVASSELVNSEHRTIIAPRYSLHTHNLLLYDAMTQLSGGITRRKLYKKLLKFYMPMYDYTLLSCKLNSIRLCTLLDSFYRIPNLNKLSHVTYNYTHEYYKSNIM